MSNDNENRPIKYVYIAGPYSNGDCVRNSHKAMEVWEQLRSLGFIPFCPHWSIIQHLVIPLEYEQWLDFDLEWIRRCDALLRMPGESSGADREVAFASQIGIPVFADVKELIAARDEKASLRTDRAPPTPSKIKDALRGIDFNLFGEFDFDDVSATFTRGEQERFEAAWPTVRAWLKDLAKGGEHDETGHTTSRM